MVKKRNSYKAGNPFNRMRTALAYVTYSGFAIAARTIS